LQRIATVSHVFVALPLNEFREIRIFREFLGIVDVRILFKTRQQRRTLRMTIAVVSALVSKVPLAVVSGTHMIPRR
jgi:hypothetical protein